MLKHTLIYPVMKGINKVKQKSLECIFLGFKKAVKGYKSWDQKNKKKLLSNYIVFDKWLGAKDVESEEVHTEVPLSNEGSFSENHAEVEEATVEQQAPKEVHAEPTNISQTRTRRVVKLSQQFGRKMMHAMIS